MDVRISWRSYHACCVDVCLRVAPVVERAFLFRLRGTVLSVPQRCDALLLYISLSQASKAPASFLAHPSAWRSRSPGGMAVIACLKPRDLGRQAGRQAGNGNAASRQWPHNAINDRIPAIATNNAGGVVLCCCLLSMHVPACGVLYISPSAQCAHEATISQYHGKPSATGLQYLLYAPFHLP